MKKITIVAFILTLISLAIFTFPKVTSKQKELDMGLFQLNTDRLCSAKWIYLFRNGKLLDYYESSGKFLVSSGSHILFTCPDGTVTYEFKDTSFSYLITNDPPREIIGVDFLTESGVVEIKITK
jgi:hypothetical protein